MYLIGYDIGSSSVKASLLNAETGKTVASAQSPNSELEIMAPRPGWAEQHPETWWTHLKIVTAEILRNSNVSPEAIVAVGIAYQMHGLVLVDSDHQVLRPSIIWCDSRAVETGERAFREIGEDKCLSRLLNSPGNFTASKLKWVKDNEPDIYSKIHKAMLPGDYIAMKLTGEIVTTPSGLSEGIMWDFTEDGPAGIVLDHYGISHDLIPELRPTFSVQGEMSREAADILGLKAGTKISYRAGDQPNNALSLNVLEPGDIATTAGTSGVVYGVSDKAAYDSASRVNPFVHVNHTADDPRYGVLMCINGTGILNSWAKHNIVPPGMDYPEMNENAMRIPPGSDGLSIIPYGNGAERTLGNIDTGAHIAGIQLNIHSRDHILRACQEGIVFAFNQGLAIMRDMGVRVETVRAGNANMFMSPLFREAFATTTNAVVELYETDGSQGAARGAGVGAGIYTSLSEAFDGLESVDTIEPNKQNQQAYMDAYGRWAKTLATIMEGQ